MTKSELISRLADHYPQLVAKDAEFAVNAILEAMTSSLVKGGRIEIRGFGCFEINHRPPRTGRNPKSGVKVPVPEKFVAEFKPHSLSDNFLVAKSLHQNLAVRLNVTSDLRYYCVDVMAL